MPAPRFMYVVPIAVPVAGEPAMCAPSFITLIWKSEEVALPPETILMILNVLEAVDVPVKVLVTVQVREPLAGMVPLQSEEKLAEYSGSLSSVTVYVEPAARVKSLPVALPGKCESIVVVPLLTRCRVNIEGVDVPPLTFLTMRSVPDGGGGGVGGGPGGVGGGGCGGGAGESQLPVLRMTPRSWSKPKTPQLICRASEPSPLKKLVDCAWTKVAVPRSTATARRIANDRVLNADNICVLF